MIDCVVKKFGWKLVEVFVGFKWFVDGLFDGSLGFGGEESAGVFFLDCNGKVWFIDKDGIIVVLLVGEIMVIIGKDLGEIYDEFIVVYGVLVYVCIDVLVMLD